MFDTSANGSGGCHTKVVKRTATRVLVAVVVATSIAGTVASFYKVRDSRRTARRVQCRSHLGAISFGLHGYLDVHGHLPPAFTTDSYGNRLHSWRTLLLPYLNQYELYEKIDLTKPWDHPDNQFAHSEVISTYTCSEEETFLHGGLTLYQAIVREDSAFPPDGSTRRFDEITDDIQTTIWVVEVSRDKAVHWMEPTDHGAEFLSSLSESSSVSHRDCVPAGSASGSSMYIPVNANRKLIESFITIAGREQIPDDWWVR